jgi:hypothetical protein
MTPGDSDGSSDKYIEDENISDTTIDDEIPFETKVAAFFGTMVGVVLSGLAWSAFSGIVIQLATEWRFLAGISIGVLVGIIVAVAVGIDQIRKVVTKAKTRIIIPILKYSFSVFISTAIMAVMSFSLLLIFYGPPPDNGAAGDTFGSGAPPPVIFLPLLILSIFVFYKTPSALNRLFSVMRTDTDQLVTRRILPYYLAGVLAGSVLWVGM